MSPSKRDVLVSLREAVAKNGGEVIGFQDCMSDDIWATVLFRNTGSREVLCERITKKEMESTGTPVELLQDKVIRRLAQETEIIKSQKVRVPVAALAKWEKELRTATEEIHNIIISFQEKPHERERKTKTFE